MSARPGTMEILMDQILCEAAGLGFNESFYRQRFDYKNDAGYPMISVRHMHNHVIIVVHKPTFRAKKDIVLDIISRTNLEDDADPPPEQFAKLLADYNVKIVKQ